MNQEELNKAICELAGVDPKEDISFKAATCEFDHKQFSIQDSDNEEQSLRLDRLNNNIEKAIYGKPSKEQ
jgi:hypothetical protein